MSPVRARIAVSFLIAAVAAPGTAAGRPHHHRGRAPKQAHHRGRAPKRAHHRRSHVPPGHVWPPSREMRAEGRACLARLTELGVHWKRGRARKQIATPVVVPDLTFGKIKLDPIWRKGPFTMDCHLAEALTRASDAFYGLGARELRFSSIWDYREVRVNGGVVHRLSRHAFGLAVDVYQVVDAQGRAHVVADNYWSVDLFLPLLERLANASSYFRTVLTPLRDPRSHDDHFHLEATVAYPPPTRARARRHRAHHRRHRAHHRRHRAHHRRHRAHRRRRRHRSHRLSTPSREPTAER